MRLDISQLVMIIHHVLFCALCMDEHFAKTNYSNELNAKL